MKTVAGRRDLGQEVEIEYVIFLLLNGSGRMFHHLLLEESGCFIPLNLEGSRRAGQDAFSTTDAFLGIDKSHLPFILHIRCDH